MNVYRCGLWLSCLVVCSLSTRAYGGVFSLVPVGATGPHIINGNEIIVSSVGSLVTLEIRVSDWDPDRDGDPLLKSYQAQIDSAGFTSAQSGTLTLPMITIPCTTDDNCGSAGYCDTATGICTQTGAFIVDEFHPNYVFSGLEVITGADVSRPNIRLSSTLYHTSGSVRDTGASKYAGTLILEVSTDARGTFTVGFTSDPDQTFFMSAGYEIFLPSALIPALITMSQDCNGNGVPDDQDIAGGTSQDCNDNGIPDECEPDCNDNGQADECDIFEGISEDCDENGVPDECEFVDCNGNGVLDVCDVAAGTSQDCNENGTPDECEPDCNDNGQADQCDITEGTSEDINGNGIPDECELATMALVPVDASGSHTITGNEIVLPAGGGTVSMEIRVSNWDSDRDGDPLLKLYQAQIDMSGFTSGEAGSLTLPTIPIPCTSDADCPGYAAQCAEGICNINAAFMIDDSHPNYVFFGLNAMDVVDYRPDIRLAALVVLPEDSAPDPGIPRYAGTLVVEVSSDARGTFTVGFSPPTASYLVDETSELIEPCERIPALIEIITDCNDNGVPDHEDIAAGTSQDCNDNGTPDECESDCNNNGLADECDIAQGTSDDCNGNDVPDECEFTDCNDNGVLDVCDILDGTSDDCDGNDVPDECEFTDCNENGVLDRCDIADGTSGDCDGNGVPDECEFTDCNENEVNDRCDIAEGTSEDVNNNDIPDECEPPGIVMVPVGATGMHFINGNEIMVLPGGETVTLEIRVSRWDLDLDGDPLLKAYQATLDSSGLTSGSSGNLNPAMIECTTDQDCFGEATCGSQIPGFCDVTLEAHPAAYVDESRPDWVFSGVDAVGVVDVSDPDFRFAGMPWLSTEAVADTGLAKYAGTLILDVSSEASGTFTVGFIEHPASYLADKEYWLIVPISLAPALITVVDDCNDNGVLDSDDIAAGTSQDCNNNGFPDECDVSFGVSSDCNGNVVPDECEPADDCNANGVQDFCDIATGTSTDVNGNGIPDECEFAPPVVVSEGCRYLAVTPSEGADPVALLVTSPDYSCLSKYVALDSGRGRLIDSSVSLTPLEWGTVHVGDAEIVPDTTYEVRADFGGGFLSLPAVATTEIWGDVVGRFGPDGWRPPDGSIDIIDVTAILDRFRNLPTAPVVELADLYPEAPDGSIDILDAALCLDAFRGLPYPYGLPCP